MKTFYDTLEVTRAASPDVIAASHKTLARRFHPDNKATANLARFRAVQTAFETLGKPEKRTAYDRYLDEQRAADKAAKATKVPERNPTPGLPIDKIIVKLAADAVRDRFGHVPGVREFINAHEKPAREAVRQGLDMAQGALQRRRAG